MAEITLEAIERLFSKQLANLPTKKDLDNSIDELTEMIQFLTKQAAHKEDLKDLATRQQVENKFGEQAVTLSFIESQLATLRKDLAQLAKRTKEDDGAFVKDILKLNHRMDQFEKQLKKMKAVHA
jgi:hypothetical protein